MEYNDLQLLAFSKIAYYNLEGKFRPMKDKTGQSVNLWNDLLSNKQKNELLNLGISEEELRKWSLAAVYDTNSSAGFYACVIETSPGNAAVAFRGSEDMLELEQTIHDWVKGDFALMNSIMTAQHKEAETFLNEYKDILNRYSNITMTGHSLGGNLAEYVTITSAKNFPWLADRIKQCVSLDGPGFSDEFLREYSSEIAQMSGKMKHYQWSFVGSLLNYLPGVDVKTIMVKKRSIVTDIISGTGRIIKQSKAGLINRHFLEFVFVNHSTGMLYEGEQDGLSAIMHAASTGVDHMPSIVGNALIGIAGGLLIAGVWAKDQLVTKDKDGKASLTSTGYGVVAGLGVTLTALGACGLLPATLLLAAKTLVVVVSVGLLVVLAAVAYELLYELAVLICDTVKKICKWTKEFAEKVKNAVVDTIDKISKWWNGAFNAGYKEAQANPQIVVDTGLLREYAGRLNTVNTRIKKLDQRLDGLYWKVGLRGLWDLITADALTGYSRRLSRCERCLIDTASDFERVEDELDKKL